MATKTTLKISQLVIHKLAQAPDRHSKEHVADLRDAIKRGVKLPRPQVMRVEGVGDVVFNGHHTIEAHEEEGYKEVDVELHKGDMDDLQLEAARANKDQNALKRSNKTKEWAIRQILRVKPNWSDGTVAREAGVSDGTVARVRKEMVAKEEIKASDKREGADGKVRKNPTKNREVNPEAAAQKLFDFARWDNYFGWCKRAIDVLADLCEDKAGKKKGQAGMNGAAKLVASWKKKLEKRHADEQKAKDKSGSKEEEEEEAGREEEREAVA